VAEQLASIVLGDRFSDALQAATSWHRRQGRKGSGLPYIGHLLAVTAIVIEAGASEDAAIAAVLHDAIEDQAEQSGGATGIRKRFGKNVADIVEACSDSDPRGGIKRTKENWLRRKEDYVAHLAANSPDVLLVSLADKIHNARAILTDLRVQKGGLWSRFRGGKKGTLWYYRSLCHAYRSSSANRHHLALVDEFDRLVTEMEQLATERV
jgi:(p)ppGpp synthase/HD superfamily hydrolase